MHRRVLAEVAREADRVDARIAHMQAAQRLERSVGRPVVDDDELERPAVDGRDGALVELLDRLLLVEDGDDDRQLWLTVHLQEHPRLALDAPRERHREFAGRIGGRGGGAFHGEPPVT